MQRILAVVLAIWGGGVVANAAPPWEDPEVNAMNRLPARAVLIPCESAETAVGIARLEAPRETSKWVQSLNGVWDFTWTSGKSGETPLPPVKIAVPGCWQLQGDYDPPLYTNITYPFKVRPPVASGETTDPKHGDWTINQFPDPVGVYEREFTVPEEWAGRRIVAHFGGVSSAMTLWVNGKEIGYSEDSRLPAEFDITPALGSAGATNTMRVAVRKFCDGSYLEDQDFWRLSGIFRDMWLVAERKDGLHDITITPVLADDFTRAKVEVATDVAAACRLYAPDGAEVPLEVANPRLWDAGEPNLYTLVVEAWGDFFAFNVGLRRVEIKDKVLLVNGKRALFKGVNRHEMSPEGGYAVTLAEMRRDIALMREFNINAVRTCHYPDAPEWYTLCDMAGIYVVCEANIESHGMGYGRPDSFAKRPEWKKAHLERGGRMVETFRNHPSIVVWSMGNESDMGPAFEEEYALMKSLDPERRPVQYEQAGDSPWTDIKCPMYAKAAAGERYCADPAHTKPYILCEYAHAMGNSTGSLRDYWDVVARHASAQGGFIWDFADQALWQRRRDGSRRLAYGGDFSDKPNDGNFCCNGLFDALRRPHPGAFEVRAVYGASGAAPLPPAQDIVFKPNFWRAPTDNDRGWKMQDRLGVWRAVTSGETPLPEGCTTNLTVSGDSVAFAFTAAAGMPPPPRVGLTFTVPGGADSLVRWHGRGPHENYSDRTAAAPVGDYAMTVADLNPNNYIIPCEQGYRTETTRLEVGGLVIEAAPGTSFGFNVWPWTQEELEKATHPEDLQAVAQERDPPMLTVNIDAAQMGVGGDDSWGARPHDEFMLKSGKEYALSFTLRREGGKEGVE